MDTLKKTATFINFLFQKRLKKTSQSSALLYTHTNLMGFFKISRVVRAPYVPEFINKLVEGMTTIPTLLTHAKKNAIPASSKFPLILFSHGFSDHNRANTVACSELASHGYVVVAIDHLGVSKCIKFPTSEEIKVNEEELKSDEMAYKKRMMEHMKSDVAFVLTFLRSCDLKDIIDFNKIGMFGMSIGGMNTINCLLNRDLGIQVGVSLDGPPIEKLGPLEVPFLLFLSEHSETYFEENLSKDKQQEYRSDLLRKADPVRITRAEHLAFNDCPFFKDYFVKVLSLPENKEALIKDLREKEKTPTPGIKEDLEKNEKKLKIIQGLLNLLSQENLSLSEIETELGNYFEVMLGECGTIDQKSIQVQIFDPMRKFFDDHLKGVKASH